MFEQRPRKRKWIIIKYEDLADKPVDGFRRLYRKCDLKWSEAVELEIRRLSGVENPKESDDPGFKPRSAAAMHSIWKHRLSSDQIMMIREHTEPVWRLFYTEKDWNVA